MKTESKISIIYVRIPLKIIQKAWLRFLVYGKKQLQGHIYLLLGKVVFMTD
jgi:hypothetical protein